LARPRLPALPDFEMALLDVLKGFENHLPSLPGALLAPREPVLITF
jgi:hypothetical protein